ncbi:hypothetical protein, partial [Armatimonas sp.]|uniref:hypothetical protein n=1 Tax=Armatimonas sp. TaxID=1872638 RepID=UPI00286C4CC2
GSSGALQSCRRSRANHGTLVATESGQRRMNLTLLPETFAIWKLHTTASLPRVPFLAVAAPGAWADEAYSWCHY